MLVDLSDLRPKNESFEHFFLKQVGRAYLFDQGARCVATEVPDLNGFDRTEQGTPKVVIDVLGVDERASKNKKALSLHQKIDKKALVLGKQRGLTEARRNGEDGWLSHYAMEGEQKLYTQKAIEACMDEACASMGYYPSFHKKIHFLYEHKWQMRGIEVKISRADFKNGYSLLPEYLYLLTPKGMLKKEELHAKAGLLEFDFEKFAESGKWRESISLVKKPKKTYDSKFTFDFKGKREFDEAEHASFCQTALFKIAQQNTEEQNFWNPHIMNLDKNYASSRYDGTFYYNIGDKTKFGVVFDRRRGKLPEHHKEKNPYWGTGQTDFYKMVEEGKGATPWICLYDIQENAGSPLQF